MGKKQHSKDRMYLTTTEWKNEWGGYKEKQRAPFKRLPFHCCAISFTPFDDPVCSDDGTVMDVVNVVPYVMRYKRHPVTGQAMQLKDLVKLNFHKNADGEYHCPVMNKVFTEHTHIVAVKPTGNVYCWEAVEELNVKAKNWKDLLTDEPFTRKDIIHIQDPLNLQQRTIELFDHVQKDLHVEAEAEEDASVLRNMSDDMKRVLGALQTQEAKDAFEKGGGGRRAEAARLLAAAKAAAGKGGAGTSKAAGDTTASASGQAAAVAPGASSSAVAMAAGGDWRLRAPQRSNDMPAFKPGALTWDTDDHLKAGAGPKGKKGAAATAAAASAPGAAGPGPGSSKLTPQQRYEAAGHVKWIASFTSAGGMSRSFTSTVANVNTKADRQMKRFERNPSKKGYVRLHTNLGDLNVELHCDIAPRTCENFIALCGLGYYDNTIFHRSIKNFMIQGGDPTGTGLGGESIYGKTFKDEVDSRLVHNGRGILSMANSGPATNGSQFFITFKSCRHLDYKHSVFGRVVGGMDVLSAMEKVATDEEDRPLEEIKVTGATVFTNPYQEMEDEEKAEEEAGRKRAALESGEAAALGDPDAKFGKWFSNPAANSASQPVRSGVGKYLNPAALPAPAAAPSRADEAGAAAAPPAKKAKVASAGLSNFDAW
mmetsp:Transcript_5593/g.12389  ORF Transcript_5593/g.12389 Transcript_5593/m.12389 type:complete len:652 (+) Transcript_5593:259-2214(+)